jgi:hypothetical protein
VVIRGLSSGEDAVQLKIAVHFVDDWRIRTASRFNSIFGGYDLCLDASDVADMIRKIGQAMGKVQAQALRHGKQPAVSIKQLDIAGHGAPGGWPGGPGSNEERLALEHLLDVGHPNRLALLRLGTLWAPCNRGMVLRMCETAQGERGRQFLVELSRTVGASVTGWDGRYEVRPTGEEIMACPDGTIECRDTGLAAFSAIYDRCDFWNNPAWRWYMYNPGFHVWRWAGRFLGAT